jgi:hypothetical protein
MDYGQEEGRGAAREYDRYLMGHTDLPQGRQCVPAAVFGDPTNAFLSIANYAEHA